MSRPWLSVIMPTYNGAAYLPAALGSLAGQMGDGVELVVVDDGSTDGTGALLRASAAALPLEVVWQAHTGNWVRNTNLGLRVARGEYACFLHQDDCWLPGRLRALAAGLRSHPGAVLVASPSRFVGPAGRPLGRWGCPLPGRAGALPPGLLFERLLVQNFLAVCAPVFRREAAAGVGGLDDALWYAADWDFWLKLSRLGGVVYIPRPLTAFRLHPGSQTVARPDAAGGLREQMRCVLDRHLHGWEGRGARRADVQRAARLSVEVNAALLAHIRGGRADWAALASAAVRAGPAAGWRYLRDSRIVDRLVARLRLRRAR